MTLLRGDCCYLWLVCRSSINLDCSCSTFEVENSVSWTNQLPGTLKHRVTLNDTIGAPHFYLNYIESIRETKLNFFCRSFFQQLLANKQTNSFLYTYYSCIGQSFPFLHVVTCFTPTTFEQKRKCIVKLYNLRLTYSNSPV